MKRVMQPASHCLMVWERPYNKHTHSHGAPALNPPGGGRNDGESIIETAWREFCEETGCNNPALPVPKKQLHALKQLLYNAPLLWLPWAKYALFVVDISDSHGWDKIVRLPYRYKELLRHGKHEEAIELRWVDRSQLHPHGRITLSPFLSKVVAEEEFQAMLGQYATVSPPPPAAAAPPTPSAAVALANAQKEAANAHPPHQIPSCMEL